MYLKLGLDELKPIRMALQLADRSWRKPRGIVEDVIVLVDKFVFPIDFVIMNIDEDVDTPLVLGQSFLST